MTATDNRSTRRAERGADSHAPVARDKILRAGLELFAAHGFDGTRTRDIAARAGVNLGLIPYYFGNKSDLWKAVVDSAYRSLYTSVGPLLSDEPQDAEQVADTIRAAVRFAARNPDFVRLMNEEGKRAGPRMRWHVDRYGRPMFDTLTAYLSRAREKGLVPDIAPLHLYYMLLGALGLIFSQAPECRRITGLDPAADEATIEAHGEAMIALFVVRAPRARR